MGFYEQQIGPVQLFVFEQFLACSHFLEERDEFVVATVKISFRLKNGQCNSPRKDCLMSYPKI